MELIAEDRSGGESLPLSDIQSLASCSKGEETPLWDEYVGKETDSGLSIGEPWGSWPSEQGEFSVACRWRRETPYASART